MKMQFFKVIFITLLSLSFFQLYSDDNAEEAFSRVYRDKIWGIDAKGNGTSGAGSTIGSTVEYREMLQNFLRDYRIRSVVDVGCGDWEFSKTINWDGVFYIGIDAVKSVIKRNKRKYSSPSILFFQGDATQLNLPTADLLICKDVLQHLPFEDIHAFLTQLSKFKYCLITNDVDPNTLTCSNFTIARGDYRLLDIEQPPFNVKGKTLLYYNAGMAKKVFLISNTK